MPTPDIAAKEFFSRARIILGAGNYEYAIELYLLGLALDPDNAAAHQELRDIALQRAANGGKPLGMFERMKIQSALRQSTADDKARMLAAEKLLAHEPAQQRVMRTAYAACARPRLWWRFDLAINKGSSSRTRRQFSCRRRGRCSRG
jgi:hypothetical protein